MDAFRGDEQLLPDSVSFGLDREQDDGYGGEPESVAAYLLWERPR